LGGFWGRAPTGRLKRLFVRRMEDLEEEFKKERESYKKRMAEIFFVDPDELLSYQLDKLKSEKATIQNEINQLLKELNIDMSVTQFGMLSKESWEELAGKLSGEERLKVQEKYNDLLKKQGEIQEKNIERTERAQRKQKELAESIEQDIYGPMQDWMTDYSKTADEMFMDISRSFQARAYQQGFKAIASLPGIGKLGEVMAQSYMSPTERKIVQGHSTGADIAKVKIEQAFQNGANMAGSAIARAIAPAGMTEDQWLARTVAGVGPMAGIPAAVFTGGGGGMSIFNKKGAKGMPSFLLPKGTFAGWWSNLSAKDKQFYAGGAMNIGMNFLGATLGGGGQTGFERALLSSFPTAGGMIGTAVGGPMGGTIGSAAGMGLAMIGRALGFGKEDEKTYTRVTVQKSREEVRSGFQSVANRLDITNRYLADMRDSMVGYTMPESYYFRQRPGLGVQSQNLTITLKTEDGTVLGSGVMDSFSDGLNIQVNRGLQ